MKVVSNLRDEHVQVALCNGVRGLKCYGYQNLNGNGAVALCNGVRGLKYPIQRGDILDHWRRTL